jgi:hypothetical protein
MKKGFLLLFAAIVTIGLINSTSRTAVSNNAGAPAGNTGSPADNKTCAQFGCHPGTATAIIGAITSDVPVSGYVPGTTYTITASVTDPTISEFGFEISPQDLTGTVMGTLALADPSRTKFTGPNNKYITHTTAGTSAPSHSNSWTINWTAPAAGTGDVTFYGAFNFSNNNQTQTGDVIHTSTLVIPEEIESGVNDVANGSSLNIYPSPVVDLMKHFLLLGSAPGGDDICFRSYR